MACTKKQLEYSKYTRQRERERSAQASAAIPRARIERAQRDLFHLSRKIVFKQGDRTLNISGAYPARLGRNIVLIAELEEARSNDLPPYPIEVLPPREPRQPRAAIPRGRPRKVA